MSANPERRVIDAIDELVDWQMEEGQRRGDGPEPVAALLSQATPEQWEALRALVDGTLILPQYRREFADSWATERPETLVHEIYTPGGDNSNPETIRIERGDPVGWQELNGVTHLMQVEDFSVSPSGEVTMTLAEPTGAESTP